MSVRGILVVRDLGMHLATDNRGKSGKWLDSLVQVHSPASAHHWNRIVHLNLRGIMRLSARRELESKI